MPSRGPHPKPDSDRQRTNEPAFERVDLGSSPVAKDAPKLPRRRSQRAEVREWWDDWTASPQASQFGRTDWRRLLMLVPLVDAYFAAAEAKDAGTLTRIAGELRLQEAKFGATPDDRMRLRWVLRPSAPPVPEAPAAAPARRRSRRSDDPRLELVKSSRK